MSRKPPRPPSGTPPRRGRPSFAGPGGDSARPEAPERGKNRGQRPAFERRHGAERRHEDRGELPRRRERSESAESGRRPRGGEDWIYGHHAVIAVLANPARRPQRLLVTSDAAQVIEKAGLSSRLPAQIASSSEIAALLPEGAVHQGFAVKTPPLADKNIDDVLSALAEGAPGVVVVLDQVTDPRNVGAILRSAAAFGASAVILPERHGADLTAALAKAASGALETVALVRVVNVSRALETLKTGGFWCVGLDARAPQTLAEIDLSGRVALVLGSEGAGLRRLVADTCDLKARLPIGPNMESLNVSAAAAIALYEVARRRAG